jgi:hypothetical protein
MPTYFDNLIVILSTRYPIFPFLFQFTNTYYKPSLGTKATRIFSPSSFVVTFLYFLLHITDFIIFFLSLLLCQAYHFLESHYAKWSKFGHNYANFHKNSTLHIGIRTAFSSCISSALCRRSAATSKIDVAPVTLTSRLIHYKRVDFYESSVETIVGRTAHGQRWKVNRLPQWIAISQSGEDFACLLTNEMQFSTHIQV